MKNIKFVFGIVLLLGAYSLIAQERFYINLSYKVIVDPKTGKRPAVTSDEGIRNAIRQMNSLCNHLNTSFVFRLYENPVDIGGQNQPDGPSKWFSTPVNNDANRNLLEAEAKQNNAYFWRENAINIYLTGNSSWGGYCSFPGRGELIAIAHDADELGTLQLHEIGHYFGLPHTHSGNECDCASATDCLFKPLGDDNISDTYPHKSCWNEDSLAMKYYGVPYTALRPELQNAIERTWKNIMSPATSYNNVGLDGVSFLTKGQLEKIEENTIGDRKKVCSPIELFSPNEVWIQNPYYGTKGTFFADVTGDGKADAVVLNDLIFSFFQIGRIVIRPSTGDGFSQDEESTHRFYGPYYGTRGTFFADVTGDGKADAIVVTDEIIVVRRSTGDGFSDNEEWTQNAYYGTKGTFFADVTGDGKADAIVVNDDVFHFFYFPPFFKIDKGKVVVRRSTGSGFSDNYEEWTQNPYYGTRGTFFADVTGDGKADAIVVNDDKIVVRRSTGSGFSDNEEWTQNPYYGVRGTFFADVTGDGKADAIAVNDNFAPFFPFVNLDKGKTLIRRSTGSVFGLNEIGTENPYYGNKGIFFSDVTGDGKADAIVVNDNGVVVRRAQ